MSATCRRCPACTRLPGARGAQYGRRARVGCHALGDAAATAPAALPLPTSATPHRRTGAAGSPENRCLVRPTASPNLRRSGIRHRQEGHRLVCAERGPAAVFLCRHLDRISRRPRHQVKADPRPSSGLWLPDHGRERDRRADPSKAMPVILTTDEEHEVGCAPLGRSQRCSGRCRTAACRSSRAAISRKIRRKPHDRNGCESFFVMAGLRPGHPRLSCLFQQGRGCPAQGRA